MFFRIKGYFLGNAVEMIAVQKEGRVLADLLTEWLHFDSIIHTTSKVPVNILRNQKYGSTFKFMRAGQPIVFTSNKQAIKDILITKNFPKSPVSETIAYPFGERFVGEGILTGISKKSFKSDTFILNWINKILILIDGSIVDLYLTLDFIDSNNMLRLSYLSKIISLKVC